MPLPTLPRRAALGLPLLLGACATTPPVPPTPAGRYASLLLTADQTASQVVDHLAAREQAEVREAGSMRFAAGAMPPNPPPPAAPAAGAVLDPAMKLIQMQAQRLAALSAGIAMAENPQQGQLLLSRLTDALAGLRGVPARWPSEPVRRRGLNGFAILAQPAPPGLDAAGLGLQRQRAVSDAVALMRAVVGDDARAGLRGALAQRHEHWRQAQNAMLNSVRSNSSISPDERMRIWQTTQARLAADPPEVAGAELNRMLDAIPAGHAAAGAGDAAGVEAFGAAVARLQALVAQAR